MVWLLLGISLVVFQGYGNADMDLYINQTETSRLLGIDAELFYINNGIINTYALSFNMPIKPGIDDIYFNWQSLRKTRPAPEIFYNLAITVSNPKAMHPPQASIPREGPVPTQLSVFSISLPCTREMSVEVDIKIQLNVSIFSVSNQTTLDIKRRKTCLKKQEVEDFNINGPIYEIPQPTVNGSYVFPIDKKDALGMNSTNIFYIAVGSACGVILLIAFIVAAIYLRGSKPMRNNERLSDTSSAALTPGQYLRADTPNNSSITGGMYTSVTSRSRNGGAFTPIPVMEVSPHEVRAVLREIQVERSHISLSEVIMEGTFGKIYHGTLIGDDENDIGTHQQIFIKTVTEVTQSDQVEMFLRECCFLKGLVHPHLLPMLACCLDEKKQPLVAFPFSNEGNLKKFLQRCKISELGSQQSLNTQQLVYMAIQIIRAIQFLHRKRIIHRDLATRNCVVDNQLTVKVTDPALSRDIFPNDYHCLGDNENRPVKWLSLEALVDRHFTPAADVWSFGVTLWELMTLGQQPYADIDPFEMSTYLLEGYRISQPMNCPDELFAVMACCWALKLEERPKMSQLLVCMQDFYTALGRFI